MIMTAAQPAHRAELAALAADYCAVSDSDTARIFGDPASHAGTLSAELHRGETVARIGTELFALRFLNNRSTI